MAPFILTSPSNRGIGLALTQHILRNTSPSIPIVATTRSSPSDFRSKLLESLPSDHPPSRLHVQHLDVHSESSIRSCAEYARETFSTADSPARLRMGYFLPGILRPEKSLAQIDAEEALLSLRTNTLGPLLLLKHFEAFLPAKRETVDDDGVEKVAAPRTAVIMILAARVGSTSDNQLGGWFSYRASKAGVISLAKTADLGLRRRSGEKACIMAYHPGTVKTDLSKEFWGGVPKDKLFEADRAAGHLVDVAKQMGKDGKGRGRCWDWKGEEVPP